MAREVIEKMTDDLDGTEATESVAFGLDGTSYEIDLNKNNAAAMRKALDLYVKAARRSAPTGKAARRKGSTRGSDKPRRNYDIGQLREWATANDIEVPSRGRIPQSIVEQYQDTGGR